MLYDASNHCMGVAYRGSALYVISGSFFMEAAGFGESWTTSQLLPWMSGTVKNNDATVYMKELVSNFMFDAAEFFIADSINGVMAPFGTPLTTCDPSKPYLSIQYPFRCSCYCGYGEGWKFDFYLWYRCLKYNGQQGGQCR